jgi:predicted N-acetyltransferase YhbS
VLEFCRSVLARGGALLCAVERERTLGVAIVHPTYEPSLAWLAFLHVSRPYRRRGAAQALWAAAVEMSLAAGARSIYVSATPTESAVGFYLRQGCRLAQPVDPDLFAAEPDDIHLTCVIG